MAKFFEFPGGERPDRGERAETLSEDKVLLMLRTITPLLETMNILPPKIQTAW